MSLKRRTLISLGLSGLGIAVGQRYLSNGANINSVANSQTILYTPEDGTVLKFVAVGDVGTGKRAQYAVARAMARRWQSSPFPLALMTGDNVYEEGEIERINEVFETPYAELLQDGVTFQVVLGNHDLRSNEGNDQVAYPGFNMPDRYYTLKKQSVQFFALDTNQAHINDGPGRAAWNDQLRWLRAELEGSSAPWKIVFAHHPIYSSGQHGSDHDLKSVLSPLFEEYDVQLYINGHDHNYERTEPINGTTYITSGNGAKLRRVGRSNWTAYAESRLGFAAFDVYPDRIVISAVGTNNEVYDKATIMLTG